MSSATTRPPRVGERNGVDYHFIPAEEFERRRTAGDFLECCQVYGRQYWYGTLVDEGAKRMQALKRSAKNTEAQLSEMGKVIQHATISNAVTASTSG